MGDVLTIEDEIVAALRRIIRGVDLHSRQLVQAVGLTWPQLASLRAIARMEPCSIGTLARDVRLGQPTLTGIIQRLERAGYITRSPNERDGRSVNVSITVKGRRLLESAPSLLQDRFRNELSRLKVWERSQTLASLQRIAEMMDVETLDASPMLVAGPVDSNIPIRVDSGSTEAAKEGQRPPSNGSKKTRIRASVTSERGRN